MIIETGFRGPRFILRLSQAGKRDQDRALRSSVNSPSLANRRMLVSDSRLAFPGRRRPAAELLNFELRCDQHGRRGVPGVVGQPR